MAGKVKTHAALILLQAFNACAGEDLNTFVPVKLGDCLRQVRGVCERAYPNLRKNHDDVVTVHREGDGDFRADQAASDHGESRSFARQRAELPVIVQCSKIDDRPFAERWAPR
jgi:hypothetical protein